MGPCSSKDGAEHARRRSTLYGRKNTLVVRPLVDIVEGDCIDKESWQNAATKVFLIFGGPGTGKGRIVANLLQMYDIEFLNVEDLLRDKLYEMVILPKLKEQKAPEGEEGKEGDADPGSASSTMSANATKEITNFIIQNPDEVTKDWLFKMIIDEIDKKPEGSIVLVDMVPNLKFLLRATAFMQKDEKNEALEAFEAKYPIRFAINLQLEKQQLFQNIALTHACTKPPADKGAAKTVEESSDEIDMSRTERRFNVYSNSVEEFITYFSNKGKILGVDTSAGDLEAVWESIRDYVHEAGVASPRSGVEQVVLFQLGEEDFVDIDQHRYPMMPISCQSLTDKNNPTPADLISNLVKTMKDHAVSTKAFLLDCLGSPLSDKEQLKSSFTGTSSSLVFVEEEIGSLDFFMHGLRRRSHRKKSIARKAAQVYKVFTTSDNDAFIFPLDADSELCRLLANGYLSLKQM